MSNIVILDKITRNVKNIPPLPSVMMRLMEMFNDPACPFSRLADVIEMDPSISIHILKVANSSFYGLSRKITSLREALIILGLDTVKHISIYGALNMVFKRHKNCLIDPVQYWLHSILTGFICNSIDQVKKYCIGEVSYAAGLIHNIGHLLLELNANEEYSLCFEEKKKTDHPFYEIENEILGTNHMEAGWWLAERWKLPDSFSDAIKCHHQKEKVNEISKLAINVYEGAQISMEILKNPQLDLICENDLILFTEDELKKLQSNAVNYLASAKSFIQ